MAEQAARRQRMVVDQLVARGVRDERVLDAMGRVPREEFVPSELRSSAYADRPLPIGHGVTISQPYIVALMAEALAISDDDRVLDVGTGSGYAAAVLAELAAHVTTVETIAALIEPARARLARYGDRVTVVHADGSLGWPADAPYDAINVAAAATEVPEPLVDQLAEGGRLVIPVGRGAQDLVRITRHGDTTHRETITAVRFVPLVGEHGAH